VSHSPELVRAIPVLPCLDIARAVAFYAERLGFAAIFRFEDHAAVMRDGSEIHLRLAKDKKSLKNAVCRIEVRGIDSLFEECRSADVLVPNGKLEAGSTSAREFAVKDADGNVITFAEDAFGA
jgi:catechol 2,3-dioxygenase-like lactoylglutathione lyase family enzyme